MFGLILIPFRLLQISCFTLSRTCFSSDSDNCPHVGIGLLLQFPHPPRTGQVLLTLLFFPLVLSSYRVLRDSTYSFLPVRYCCELSAGVLQHFCVSEGVFLMYPLPPTPPPSCSVSNFFFFFFNYWLVGLQMSSFWIKHS